MKRLLGMEILGLANMIRRVTFNDLDIFKDDDRPTQVQHFVLVQIWHSTEDVYQRDLEKKFRIRRSTIAEILKGMEKKGLIIRTSSPLDKRTKKIELTQKAIEMCEEEKERVDETERRLTDGLSADDIDTFYMIMDKMLGNLQKEEHK